MSALSFHIVNATEMQLLALKEVAPVLNVTFSSEGLPVRLEQGEQKKMGLRWSDDSVTLFYYEPVQLFRAMGLLVESCRAGKQEDITETPWHTLLAPMVDCSRNQVNTVSTVKRLVRHLALMGYNGLQLYTEDTYEIPEQPYFGYMRGRYTADEIREIDRYCQLFGIELIPCIQVLAHLNALTRWNVFKPLFDVDDILLVGDSRTYEFIEQMLRSVTSMFTSRRINIGMDEAFLLGCGQYLDKNGYQKRPEIMRRHLKHIMELCRKYELKPMMWSDMFFHTAADGSTRHYYDTVTPLPENIQDAAPEDISLIFWDYYHKEVDNYDKLIGLHKQFPNDIAFAGGAWKWKGFTPFINVSFAYSRAALESCRKNNITTILLTVWDDGAECSHFAVLPVLQFYAEECYRQDTTQEALAQRLATCAQANLADFTLLDEVNRDSKNPLAADKEASLTNPPNASRYLLWQDVLQGLYEKHIEGNVSGEEFAALAPLYREAATRNPAWNYIFDVAATLCDVLALKSEIGIRLRHAYQEQDKAAMADIADNVIPEIQKRLQSFHDAVYAQWTTDNKIFGFDVFDMRVGSLSARLSTAAGRIHQYLNGQLPSLEELEQEILWADCRINSQDPSDVHVHFWHQCATVSVLKC